MRVGTGWVIFDTRHYLRLLLYRVFLTMLRKQEFAWEQKYTTSPRSVSVDGGCWLRSLQNLVLKERQYNFKITLTNCFG